MTHQSVELEVVIVRVGQHDVGQRGLGRHQAGGGGGGRGGLGVASLVAESVHLSMTNIVKTIFHIFNIHVPTLSLKSL